MKCKSCNNEIPDGSIFCMFCGEKQIREKKKKQEIKVPKPKKLPSGSWWIYLRAEGQSVTEATPELCITKAKAIRAGFVKKQKEAPKTTLSDAITKYIDSKSSILSPSTIVGYQKIKKNHFKKYQGMEISKIDWQMAVNEESEFYSPKSVYNAWGLVASTLRYETGNEPPKIKLPRKEEHELPWLNYEQIQIFLEAIKGTDCEMAALLALHSLRRSEVLAITPEKIKPDGIHVEGARVYVGNDLVEKKTNKTSASRRIVPIMIPRLQELIDASDVSGNTPYIQLYHHTILKHINKICAKNGLPQVGFHGLRRSFASLAYHLGWTERQTMAIGGWDDLNTMHKIYIKLDKSDIDAAAATMQSYYELHMNLHTRDNNP